MHDRYTIITTDDIVIPPDSEYDSFQKIKYRTSYQPLTIYKLI